MHFHCPDCHPQLVPGATPAICGRTIPAPVVGTGPVRKCPDCKSAIRSHKKTHTR
ncbi:hypothetical protein ACGF3K_14460 [Streptomyces sp. NPDC047980]|uniref:hypothetical protein n=1 Tax=Streptomyces sp. NPDC047980 TaxID=3365494 RepID=UPI0037174F84